MRIKVGAMLIALALLALVYGSAALTTVAVDRTFNAVTLKLNAEVDGGGADGTYGTEEAVRIMTLIINRDAVSFDLAPTIADKPTSFTPSDTNAVDNSGSPNPNIPLPPTKKDPVVPIIEVKPVPANKPPAAGSSPPPIANAGVKLEVLNTYEPLLTTNEDGVVFFDLSKALVHGAAGFNPNAQFTIGSADAGVFRITNNSKSSIKVSLEAGQPGLVVKDSNGGTTSIIASGAAQTFYCEIDTTGLLANNAIGGTLQIRTHGS